MSSNSDANKRTPSTTFEWRKVKISRAPQASTDSRPKGVPAALRARRDPRRPLTVTIVYRGGAEAWWELRARGMVVRRPGHVSLHDALSALEGERER